MNLNSMAISITVWVFGQKIEAESSYPHSRITIPLHTDRIEFFYGVQKILAAGERGRYAAQNIGRMQVRFYAPKSRHSCCGSCSIAL